MPGDAPFGSRPVLAPDSCRDALGDDRRFLPNLLLFVEVLQTPSSDSSHSSLVYSSQLLGTSASLLVTTALLVVTTIPIPIIVTPSLFYLLYLLFYPIPPIHPIPPGSSECETDSRWSGGSHRPRRVGTRVERLDTIQEISTQTGWCWAFFFG